MYPISSLRAIRAFELFLFGGVPESAEQMYERDSNTYTEERITRRGVSCMAVDQFRGRCIGTIEINLKTGDVVTTEELLPDREEE